MTVFCAVGVARIKLPRRKPQVPSPVWPLLRAEVNAGSHFQNHLVGDSTEQERNKIKSLASVCFLCIRVEGLVANPASAMYWYLILANHLISLTLILLPEKIQYLHDTECGEVSSGNIWRALSLATRGDSMLVWIVHALGNFECGIESRPSGL